MCDQWFRVAEDEGQWRNLIDNVLDEDIKETLRVLEKMWKSFMQQPIGEPGLALAVVEAVCAATKAHKQHCGVARKGLRMLRLLQMHEHAKGTRNEIETVKTVLYENGLFDMEVRDGARNILRDWDWLGLSDIEITSLKEALAKAEQYQAQRVYATKQNDILECLYDLRYNAQWDSMTVSQQLLFRPQVADFVLWCMHNYPPENSPSRLIGELACRVLLKMVAGCMQEDDERLQVTCLCYLVNLGVGPLWATFSVDAQDENIDFEWLAQRLVCAPVEHKKRVRAAGDSA